MRARNGSGHFNAAPSDEPSDVLKRIRPLHRLVYQAVQEHEDGMSPVTIDRLVSRMRSFGYHESAYSVTGAVNELARLSLLKRDADGAVELDAPIMVLGEVS